MILTIQEAWALRNSELQKAETQARGGGYHKRVTRDDGSYRYYYDQDTYNRDHGTPDDHVDGQEAGREHLSRHMKRALDDHGDDGVPLEHFTRHVRRHGHKAVHEALTSLGVEHRDGRVHRKARRAVVPIQDTPSRTPKAAEDSKPKAKAKAVVPAKPTTDIEKASPLMGWRLVRFRGL